MALTTILCRRDPVLDWIRETYAATPLHIPESRIQPATAAISTGSKTRFVGELRPLLRDDLPLLLPETSVLTSLQSKQTTKLSSEVGTPLLMNMLSALNESAGEDASSAKLASQRLDRFSFCFPDATRIYVQIGKLALALKDAVVASNPLTQRVLKRKARILIIDSVFVSKSLGISTHGARSATIAASLSEAFPKLKVNETASDSLQISASKPVTFAFSSVGLVIGERGKVNGLELDEQLTSLRAAEDEHNPIAKRIPLAPERTLFSWDQDLETE